MVQARHVRLGQEPAVRVDREPAAQRNRSALDEGAPLALPAEPEVLDLAEDGEGEAIVDLGDVDVGRPDPGHRERARRRLGEA